MNTIYDFTVPVFIKQLGGLKLVLQKAEDHIKEKGLSEEELLNSRVIDDMYPLVRQIQIACDNAKGATSRLAGIEPPKWEDTEKTIPELQARVDKTIEYINSI